MGKSITTALVTIKMKNLILLLTFSLALPLHAAVTYRSRDVEFIYDSSQGSFDKGGGKLRGAIIGFTYALDAFDDVTQTQCTAGGLGNYKVPLLQIPQRQQILDDIAASVKQSGLVDYFTKCLAQIKAQRDLQTVKDEDQIQGLNGSPIAVDAKADPKSIGATVP